MRGSMFYHFEDQFPQAISELEQLKRDGKIRMPETILEGLEKAPTAFEELFAGRNIGKLIIKMS
jgi:NADPH-dependent curcumin reductase CurA